MANKTQKAVETQSEPEINILTQEEIEQIIKRYEQQFGISSDEFFKRWKEGTMPDTFETNDWAMLLDYL